MHRALAHLTHPGRSTLPRALTLTALAGLLLGCSADDSEPSGPAVPEGRRETRDGYTIAWLHGTPYEMGYQHGTLLKAELAVGMEAVHDHPLLSLMFDVSTKEGLIEVAKENSYPEIVEECQGMVDAASDVGVTMDICIGVAAGDLLAEAVAEGIPDIEDIEPGCLQVVATDQASADGKLYHARLMDWTLVEYAIENPTIFVRQPNDGIGHIHISYPGVIAPYQGMNAEGIVVASNQAYIRDNTVHDRTGESHVQMLARILAQAKSVDEAREMVTSANHMTLETLGVSDAEADEGEFYEMAPAAVGVRSMTDGLVYATNHFVSPETEMLDEDPVRDHSAIRWERLEELLEPTSPNTLYGSLDPETLVTVLRDRINPRTGEESPVNTFDDGKSIATDGALYALVFDPAELRFWFAAGAIPVPQQTFYGFSLGELLGLPGHENDTVTDIP